MTGCQDLYDPKTFILSGNNPHLKPMSIDCVQKFIVEHPETETLIGRLSTHYNEDAGFRFVFTDVVKKVILYTHPYQVPTKHKKYKKIELTNIDSPKTIHELSNWIAGYLQDNYFVKAVSKFDGNILSERTMRKIR